MKNIPGRRAPPRNTRVVAVASTKQFNQNLPLILPATIEVNALLWEQVFQNIERPGNELPRSTKASK